MRADKVVFPGQGAMGNCMKLLRETGLDAAVQKSLNDKPFLGICLGLQTLLENSEENAGSAGFGVLKGNVRQFSAKMSDPVTGQRLKIPHMGWNQVQQSQQHDLWKNIADNSRFYFVHSYYADPVDKSTIAAQTDYPTPFVSAVAYDNVFATQFHPEKSQHAGLQLLKNFLKW